MGSRPVFYLFFWDAACFAAARRACPRALTASSRRFRFRRSSRRRSVPRPDKQTSFRENQLSAVSYQQSARNEYILGFADS
jgi:hypothetical protein